MTAVDLLLAVRTVAAELELVGADVVEVIPTGIGTDDYSALVADRVAREALTGIALAPRLGRISPPRRAPRPRGTTTTGTGEWRTIFDAREPRKTRATGPIELEPTTSTSPSSHSMSSSASSQLSPRPTTASSCRGTAGSSATCSSAARPAA